MEKGYITPTKEAPIFQVWNTYVGYVVTDYCSYKDWEIKTNNCHMVGETTATDLPGAMEALFSHIGMSGDMVESGFTIEMLDSTTDKNGEPRRTRVFTLSTKQARKYGLLR